MKVVVSSDLHGERPEFPDGDLLLIAGDVCPVNESHDVHVQRNYLRGDFNDWLIEQEDRYTYGVKWIAGNHDFACEAPGFRRVADELAGEYLQDDLIEVNGVRIYGSPWVPNLRRWAFYADERKWDLLADAMPEADIMLMHGPPFGILDLVRSGEAVGSPMRKRIIELNPQRVVFGHIHESYGYVKHAGIHWHNVAYVDEYYIPGNPAHEFEV